jgi:hypothetical protein
MWVGVALIEEVMAVPVSSLEARRVGGAHRVAAGVVDEDQRPAQDIDELVIMAVPGPLAALHLGLQHHEVDPQTG